MAKYWGWKYDMCEMLKDGECGDFKLEHFTVERSFQAMMQGVRPGEYTRLVHDGEVVMSDTPMEKNTNSRIISCATGDVLIGGLGLGMILLEIQDKEDVHSITVIEKNQEVIDLVGSQLPLNCKVNIICADVFEWTPEPGTRYDTIYMDIWNILSREVYDEEMKPLNRKWGRYLKPASESPNRFNGCWGQYNAMTGAPLR